MNPSTKELLALASFPISSEVPNITALHTIFRNTYDAHFRFQGEFHDFYELVCVLEGKALITSDRNVFEVDAGHAILHPPMQFHNISSIADTSLTILVFTFSGKHIPPLENRACRIYDLFRVKEIYGLARRAFDIEGNWVLRARDDSYRTIRVAKELELLLLQLADHSREQTPLKNQGVAQYSAIVKTMEDHIQQRLTVKELADLCGLSQSGLQKAFSKYAGMGVMEYFTRQKMQLAARLLSEGNTIKESAAAIGYTDQNYFSTVYKRVTGNIPSKNKAGNKPR